MHKHLLMLGLVPTLALGACGGGADRDAENAAAAANMAAMDPDPMTNGDAMDANAMAGTAVSPGQRFADEAGASDYFEIEAGKLAQEKAQAQPLKDFGKMMVEQHTASTDKLKAAGAQASPAIVPNPVLNTEQEAALAALRSAEGAAFDAAYKAQQITAHEKALETMQTYAATGEVASLKTFAGNTSKVVEAHLKRIRAL